MSSHSPITSAAPPTRAERLAFISPSLIVLAASALAVAATIVAVVRAYEWPLVHDEPLIHYVVFLMQHGFVPYRDIVEINMPGTYLIEAWAMRLLGGDAFGWWLWDSLIGLALTAGAAWVAGPGRRAIGVLAGALAWLSHLAGGMADLGQRDWAVSALLMLSTGGVFQAVRSRRPEWMAGFMACCALAASIKPPSLMLGAALLVAVYWPLSAAGTGERWSIRASRLVPYIAWSLAGGAAVAVVVVGYLWYWGAIQAFVDLSRGLVPWYASLHRLPLVTLAYSAFVKRPLVFGALILFLSGRSWRHWEADFLALATAIGVLQFFLQGKGWAYHAYVENAFAALWALIEVQRALAGRSRWGRRFAAATLGVAMCVLAPRYVMQTYRTAYSLAPLTHLQNDLSELGGPTLSGRVQCLDMTRSGCINALYRLKIVQATGFVYDFYLFPDQPNPVAASLQQRFMSAIENSPPAYIVLGSHDWPADTFDYSNLNRWPEFRIYLARHYHLAREYAQRGEAGYRIYALND